MANATQFIGSRISLISKAEIRYEGILYALDIKDATISLAKVRSFGTEDRPTEHPAALKDEVYEFIIFRGSDIKCIDVLEPPKQASTSHDGLPNDPAIVEVSHYHSRNQPSGSQSSGGRGGGGAGGSNANQSSQSQAQSQSQNENVFEGLLRRGRHNDAGVQVRRSLRRNGSSTNEERGQERSNDGRQDRRGDRGGGSRQGQGQGFQGRRPFNYSPRGAWVGRGGFRRPQGILRAPQSAKVTFEQDFDFEKSHEELLTKMKDVKVSQSQSQSQTENNNANAEVKPNESEEQENKDPHIFYKKDEFFDAISCEALERTKGSMARPDWRKELKINAETFGLSGQRRNFYQGGRSGFYNNYRGGYDNRWSYNSPRGSYNRFNNGPNRGSF